MLDKSFGRGGNLPPDCHYTLWCRESRIRRPLPRNPARKCVYRSAFRISSVCKARGEIESFKRGPSPISWTTICRGSWAAGILHIPRMSPGPQRRVRTSREQNFWTFSRITFPHLIRSLNYSSSLLSKMEDSRVIFWIWFFPTLSYDPTKAEKVWMVERDWLESSGTRSHRWVDTRGYARVRFHGQATGDRAHALVTPICLLLASAERKRSGCLPLAFRHTPTRALTPPPSSLAKHVPNLEQRRRHANPWDLGPDASILPVFPTRGSERPPPPLSVSFSPFL